MYNRRYIIPGIGAFIIACLFPFLLNIASGPYERPALVLPADAKECIEPVAFMRSEHMQILNEWRDAAIREDTRSYTASTGKIWEASLQNTCMSCHTNRQAFCGTCHDANSVRTDCWSCHIEPEALNPKTVAKSGGKNQ